MLRLLASRGEDILHPTDENIGQRWTGPRQAGLHAGRLPCDLSVLLVSCLAEPLVASLCKLIINIPCRSSPSKCEGMAQHAADSGKRPVRSLALSCSHKCQSSPVHYSPCHLSSSSASSSSPSSAARMLSTCCTTSKQSDVRCRTSKLTTGGERAVT